jgi:type I restriction enzyme S subunit
VDILFARRNAYLRRASMVDFNGCCSGDAFVLREDHDKVVPGFLAFLLNSNVLWDYANSNAAGTMSKRVKWRDLAEYEFLLPPKDQQAKLAELLWAMDEVIEKENEVLEKLIQQKLTTIESLLTAKQRVKGYNSNEKTKESRLGYIPLSWNLYKLKEILNKGRLGGNYQNSESERGVPLIKMGNLSRGKINLERIQYIPEGLEYDSEDILKDGDLLFNTRNTLELVGKVAIWKNELPKALYNSNIMRFEFNNDIISSNDFMNLVFNSRRGINQLRSFATGTTSVAAIYSPELMRFKCVIPSKKEQEQIVNIADGITKSITSITSKLESSRALQNSLINQVF